MLQPSTNYYATSHILAGSSDSIIFQGGDQLPGLTSDVLYWTPAVGYGGHSGTIFAVPMLTGAGMFVMTDLTETNRNEGIWVSRPGTPRKVRAIAIENHSTGSGWRVGSSYVALGTWTDMTRGPGPSRANCAFVNDHDQLAFLATYQPPDINDDSSSPVSGLFAVDVTYNRRYVVARVGDVISGLGTISEVQAGQLTDTSVTYHDNLQSGYGVINNCGSVAFWVECTNRKEAVVTWQIPNAADLDQDGSITSLDYTAFSNAASSVPPNLDVCDFDGDGTYTIADYVLFSAAASEDSVCTGRQ